MKDTGISPLDLLDLPDLHREIVLHLTRRGPTDATTLAHTLSRDLADVSKALATLAQEGRIRLAGDGQVEAVLGRVRSRLRRGSRIAKLLDNGDTYDAKPC